MAIEQNITRGADVTIRIEAVYDDDLKMCVVTHSEVEYHNWEPLSAVEREWDNPADDEASKDL